MLDASIIEALNLKTTVSSIVQTIVQALSIFCIFLAANSFGKRIFKTNIFIIFGIGFLASSALIANEYRHMKNAENATIKFRLLTETKLVEFPEGIEKVMPVENRKSTIIVARDAYITHGKIIDYIAEDGKRSKFSPNEIDIQDRDKRITIIASLELIAKQAASSTYNWLVMVLLIFLASYFAGILSRKNLKTSA